MTEPERYGAVMDNNRPVREERPATWRAYNTHLMDGIEYRYTFPDGTVTEWRSEGFSAEHSMECECDDWDNGEGWD